VNRRGARILVITGPGKGKTTAATGTLMRALAYGKKALLVRFAKAAHSGEIDILSTLPNLAIVTGDHGMTPKPDDPRFPGHVRAARALFEQAKTRAPGFDLIVLDELCGIVARGMIEEDEAVSFLRSLRPDQAAILTGRGASPKLIAAADTVSDIRNLKHAYDQGIPAEPGIEY
jgi:cob(I)alamin adenosyltransferase